MTLAVSAIVRLVRPWYAWSNTTTACRPVACRAILTAFSTASAPELNSAERFSWSPGVSRASSSQTATYPSYGVTMKQVWVKAATCSCTAATTRGDELPTLSTAIPDPRSISELPSTSTITPPPARSTKTGRVRPTPAETVASRRASRARDRGPGTSVTSRRSCATVAGPLSTSVIPASSGWVLGPRAGTNRRQPGSGPPPGIPSGSAFPQRRGVHFVEGLGVPVSISELLRTPGLALTLHTTAAPVDRAISWVHVSELADPAPFLEGGELLLTTGLALRPEQSIEAYVQRLAEAGVVGLGLGTG